MRFVMQGRRVLQQDTARTFLSWATASGVSMSLPPSLAMGSTELWLRAAGRERRTGKLGGGLLLRGRAFGKAAACAVSFLPSSAKTTHFSFSRWAPGGAGILILSCSGTGVAVPVATGVTSPAVAPAEGCSSGNGCVSSALGNKRHRGEWLEGESGIGTSS